MTTAATPESPVTLRGFANVHSHAFQRALRGRVQRKDPARDDSFWTWRDAMYGLANRLTLEDIERLARQTYRECLEAGYTAIGEFHYLHHQPNGSPYPDPGATARAHLRAARDTGIRLTLLWCAYHAGGIERPLTPSQRRFGVASLDAVWRAVDDLAADVQGTSSRLGLAIHSVRAVPRSWLVPLADGARTRGLPIHAHVSEQPREVAACQARYGVTPIRLLHDAGVLGPDFTGVHATWLAPGDLDLISASGATICICPSTEGDLGDGVPDTAGLYAAGVPLTIGSDSHAIIDPFCELRLLAYQARARQNARCVLANEAGQVAPTLAAIGSDHGYRALGLPSDGDRVILRQDDPVFEGVEAGDDRTATALIGGHRGLVDRVEVAGACVVRNGRHLDRGGG